MQSSHTSDPAMRTSEATHANQRGDSATQPKYTVQFEVITPEVAQEYLTHNTRNRKLSKPYARQLAQELEQGRWKPTHQGIAFDANGALVDGQHRLQAIVSSGVSAPIQVTRGVDPEAFDVIDQHLRRTAAQIVAMGGGTKDAPRVIAMARAIRTVAYKEGRVSNAAAVEYYAEHKDTLERYLPVARKYTQAVGAAFAWCDMLGWEGVEAAAQRLVETLWDSPEDPMRALHRRSESADFRRGNGQSGVKVRFDIALNCLQAVHDGRPLKVARVWMPDYAALERAAMRPGAARGIVSVAPAAAAEDDGADQEPPPAAAEPPAGSLAAGGDPELDAVIAEQVARNRPGAIDAALGPPPAVGEGRVVRRKAKTREELDAALDEAVRAANGR